MRYPFPANFSFPTRTLLEKIRTGYEDFRIGRRERRAQKQATISPVTKERGLSQTDLPLVFITRNEMAILPAFLNHYRMLGVTRFICVDDQSTDGTREYLCSQADVDVWSSPIRFQEARRGRLWRETLFARYGVNRWYINVDTDELLVYDRYESEELIALIRVLESAGIRRLPAPMIDLYGEGIENVGNVDDPLKPWMIAKYFDGDGYDVALDKRGLSVLGGPRKRLFGDQLQLIKYPLIYWDSECRFGSSIHRPLPYQRNFAPIWGVLLHFKFYVNYREKIQEAAEGKQHYNGAHTYQVMTAAIAEKGKLELKYEKSQVFAGPEQLIDLGFMPNIPYRRDEMPLPTERFWTPSERLSSLDKR